MSSNEHSTRTTTLDWLRRCVAEVGADPSSPPYSPHHEPSETSSLLAFKDWEREHEVWEAEDREWSRLEWEPRMKRRDREAWFFALVVFLFVVMLVGVAVWDLTHAVERRGGGGNGMGWKDPERPWGRHGGVGEGLMVE